MISIEHTYKILRILDLCKLRINNHKNLDVQYNLQPVFVSAEGARVVITNAVLETDGLDRTPWTAETTRAPATLKILKGSRVQGNRKIKTEDEVGVKGFED